MTEITHKRFADFQVKFYKNEWFLNLRFGQSFCNQFNITNDALFYEEDISEAVKTIYEDYIEFGCDLCGASTVKDYETNCTGKCT